jgi:hypothetical protein
MFRLNRNKQKTNRNSFVERIFWYFFENIGLFRFVLKHFCLSWCFDIGWKHRNKPKQTEIFTETDLVSVCFGLNQKKFFCFEDTLFVRDYGTIERRLVMATIWK